MSLRQNAVDAFDSRISGTATLLSEYNNTDELFYVGIKHTTHSETGLISEMNDVLNALDDVMENVTIAPDGDLQDMGVSSTEYDVVLRVAHTLS